MGELRQRGRVWWIRHYRNGQRFEESSGSAKKGDAITLLKLREGDGAHGLPVTPKIGRLRFEEAAADVVNDYRTNGKRSLDEVERRIAKHLQPFFGGRRMTAITTAEVRAYIVNRQGETEQVRRAYDTKRKDGTIRRVSEQRRTITGVSNGEINRELTILKRIFSLAMQAGKLLHKPHIPLLREDNARTGFFEPDAVRQRAGASAGGAASRGRIRLHHGLARHQRDPAARMAERGLPCRRGAARRGHDEEPARAACSR